MSHSTAEAGELSPRDPVEGRGHRQVAPLEGKTANTPRLGPVSTSRQRIAELARQALGMAVAIAWLPGPAGTRRRVAKLSVEEPDAAEPARPDLWGARVSNDPGLPDPGDDVLRRPLEPGQYLSMRYTDRLVDAGIAPSVGSQGDAYDNALAESVIGLYKTEVIRRKGPWRTLEAVEFATLTWVDWFNTRRLLGPLGDIPPAEFEAQYYEQAEVA